MSKIENVVSLLKQTKPAEIAELDFVKDRFITIYNQLHGSDKGELIYHKELFNYKKLISETPALRECSPLSLYGCFLDINVNALSLETGNKPDCYITTRSFKIGKDEQGKDIYEKRAVLSISPYGEVKMRMRSGQIKYIDNPVVVYDCDEFKVGLNDNGKLVVKQYEAKVPKPDGSKIIACFVRIERYDGSFEMPYLDMDAVKRLKAYSNKNNFGTEQSDKSNALYTSNGGQIDTGFLAAKTIKHAFKSYPKVRTGQFSELEPIEEIEPEKEIDYGIDAGEHSANAIQDVDHEEVTDEFDQALNEHKEEKEPTKVIAGADDENEPEF